MSMTYGPAWDRTCTRFTAARHSGICTGFRCADHAAHSTVFRLYGGMLRFRPMMPGESRDITRLLAAWGDGDREALDGVVASLYPELRRIARRQLAARAPGGTLESAAPAQ